MIRKALLAAGAAACVAAPAHGFGARSHLWIAEQVYADLADCRLTIRGEAFDVPAETCRSILRNRGALLAGSIGPDAFPDLVVGQSIVHPGVDGGWQANQWLEHLLTHAGACPESVDEPGENAAGCEEAAFAWGYGLHFAGDVFAHSYVNNYAGEEWNFFTGGRGDELRHFRLEKYIDQFLPFEPDAAALRVPSAFLARQLVEFDYFGAAELRRLDLADIAGNPEHYIGEGVRRLRDRGTSMHLTAMLGALVIAKAAQARAPGVYRHATDEVNRTLAELAVIEEQLRIPRSRGVPIDRRDPAFRGLGRSAREELRRAHAAYESAVDEQRLAHALVVFTRDWPSDIQQATERYIHASLEFAKTLARESGGPPRPYSEDTSLLEPYQRWLACYSDVFRGASFAASDVSCARLREMGQRLSFAEAALRAGMGNRVRSFYFQVLQLQRYFSELLARVAIRIVSIADRRTAQLIRELIDPARVTAGALNDAFDDSRHGRISFRCVVDWIDADLGLRAPLESYEDAPCDGEPRHRDTIDPMQFAPLEYALILAKLSLLGEQGVRQVAERFGGTPAEMRLTGGTRYSLLIDTVRSLDGNQQWQHLQMPYPRLEPYSGSAPARSAGYPEPGLSRRYFGFPFYQTAALRRSVFATLFPRPFEGGILERREMRPPHYPFWPCPGDPLRGPLPAEARPIDGCPG